MKPLFFSLSLRHYVEGCGLSALPVEIGELPALERLGVAHNAIAALPPSLGTCAALTVRRCKLDPGLKALGFKNLTVKMITVLST